MRVQIGVKMALVALILALAVMPAAASGGLVWHTATVDSSGDRGTHTSIAFNPSYGTPWISYYDEDNGDLMVARRVSAGGNCGPNNGWNCETVDSTNDVGQNSSIDVYVNPAIIGSLQVGVAYQDVTVKALKFAEYSCSGFPPACSWNVVTIEQAGAGALPGYGRYTSIKYDADGTPHIAYYVVRYEGDIIVSELRFASRVSSGGNCGVGSAAGKWRCIIVEGSAGEYASLDISLLTPYIAYYKGSTGDLRYASPAGSGAGNCGPGNTWYCYTVDGSVSDVGQAVSFRAPAFAGDQMRFAYYDATNGKLRYAVYVGVGSGNCGPSNSFLCYTIEAAASPSGYRNISLAVDSAGNPLIAYQQVTFPFSQLRVAQPASDPSKANCGVPDGGFFPTWQCFTVDTAGTLFSIASHVSADFDPDDLPMIAYSQSSISTGDTNLKIAYGQIGVFLPLVLRNYP